MLRVWLLSLVMGFAVGDRTAPTVDAAAVERAATGVRSGDLSAVRELVAGRHDNIHEILFLVMKEAIAESDEDKKYWLQRLAAQKRLAEQLTEYQKHLEKKAAAAGDGDATVQVMKTVDLGGDLAVLVPDRTAIWTAAQLRARIAELQTRRASLREVRIREGKKAKELGLTRRQIQAASQLWVRILETTRKAPD